MKTVTAGVVVQLEADEDAVIHPEEVRQGHWGH